MKKFYLLIAVLTTGVMVGFATLPQAIQDVLPSCADFINDNPYPTKATDTEAWEKDSSLYFEYKLPYYDTLSYEPLQTQFNQAHAWAHLNEQYYFCLYRLTPDSVMGAPFIEVSWNENKPYSTVNKTRNTTNFPEMNALEQLCEEMKEENTEDRVRPRPYKYFLNQYYNGKPQTQDLDATGSYPSGHGYFRGLFGKCLEIIDPENNDAIQKMMDEWLFCRLQKGAHWYSDLPAGVKLGEMAFANVMMVDLFRNQVYAAKAELQAYREANNIPTNSQPEATDIEDGIETYLAGVSGTTNFTIHRLLYKDGYFNTLCLPFSLTAEEIATGPLAGCELYAFEGATKNGNDDLELRIIPVTAIEAGTPYLIKWESGDNIISMTFNDVTITARAGKTVGTGEVQFVGIMGQASLTAGDEHQLFLGANNTLHYPKSGSTNPLKGFRAYFKVSESANNTPARFVIRPNSPTAIDNAENYQQVIKRFEDGQLIILRDGTKYNAQGQIVK